MTLAAVGAAVCVVCEAHRQRAEFFCDKWECVGCSMRPILFWWCRLEKEDSDNGDDEMIGAILKARGRNYQIICRCVECQMMMIPAALCRSVENLHGDMSYVLIGGPMWKIRRRQWSWWQWSSFWRWKFNLGHLWRLWSSQEKARKRFTDKRSRGSRKY